MEVYVAGAAAAFTVDMLIFPLDTLKTRYQSQDYIKTYSTSQSKPLALRGLYQGIGSAVLATLPAAGVFFSTYEASKTTLSRTLPLPDPLIHSAASSIAEAASCSILAPAEVIKQHAQMLRTSAQSTSSGTTSSTSLRAFRTLYSPGAASRLFSGYTALVARNLPFTALQFPMFEYIRSYLWSTRRPKGKQDKRGLAETGLIAGGSAASAGAVAAFITTPSDVVKTRMMLTATEEEGRKKRMGSWEVAKAVCRERGFRGLFRGGLFRSAWTAIGSGLYLGTYDSAKLWLMRRKRQMEEAGI